MRSQSSIRYLLTEQTHLFPPLNSERLCWFFHSEAWPTVVHRRENRAVLKNGGSISVLECLEDIPDDVKIANDAISVVTGENNRDRWVYCFLNPLDFIWHNFSWKFNVRRCTNFRELQFGFRYRDFYNRYRFRHEDDFLYFDKVLNGRFLNGLASRSFKMDMMRAYAFEIKCIENVFTLFIDGNEMLSFVDCEDVFTHGSIALIFWEDDMKTPIVVDVFGITVSSFVQN